MSGKNPNASYDVLVLLAKDKHALVRASVASNANCPLEILSVLAKDKNNIVKEKVAENKNTTSEILEMMKSKSKVGSLLHACIAKNPNVSQKILDELADENDFYVISNIIENPSTPSKTLSKILDNILDNYYDDEDSGLLSFCSDYICENPNASTELLERMCFIEDISTTAKNTLASCKKITPKMAAKLSVDENDIVRENLASNKNISFEILNRLTKDQNENVRSKAKANLLQRAN